ncbi:MAG: formylglycine-generating enzyme family protein [Deltaproteobacteria bacterium]|nr:formylglycine-generating enzyme family protein [Deltaproteobacteria bacterium]
MTANPRSRAALASLLPVFAIGAGCGGAPFEPTAGSSVGADAAPPDAFSHPDASDAKESGPGKTGDASAAVLDAAAGVMVESPCGMLRASDADFYAGETCIEAGSFSMGSDSPNLGEAFADHTPAHQVSLSRFVIDTYEVTVGRFRACVQAGLCVAPPTGATSTWSSSAGASDALPIIGITWEEASGFCAWDGGRTLPTEAQWEYAARGPGASVFPWGEDFACSRAVLGGYSGGPCAQYVGGQPRPVGSVPPADPMRVVFDIIGNVAEWVADYAGSYAPGPTTDPKGPKSGAMKIVRGGSWASGLVYGYGYARATAPADMRGPVGFRCVRAQGR